MEDKIRAMIQTEEFNEWLKRRARVELIHWTKVRDLLLEKRFAEASEYVKGMVTLLKAFLEGGEAVEEKVL